MQNLFRSTLGPLGPESTLLAPVKKRCLAGFPIPHQNPESTAISLKKTKKKADDFPSAA